MSPLILLMMTMSYCDDYDNYQGETMMVKMGVMMDDDGDDDCELLFF